MKVVIITLLAMVATLTSGIPQFAGLHATGPVPGADPFYGGPQIAGFNPNPPPGYSHNDASQMQASRNTKQNAKSAQGSQINIMSGNHAEGHETKLAKFNGIFSRNRGNSSSSGGKYYQSESFGELWDDKLQWDDTIAATEATIGKDSYLHADKIRTEEGMEGSVAEAHMSEGDAVDIRDSHSEGREEPDR